MSDTVNCYAEALYTLAQESNVRDEVLDDTQKLKCAFDSSPQLLRILTSHEISREERRSLLDGCFKGIVHTYVLSCLKLMCDKGDIKRFPGVCRRIKQLYNDEMGILSVSVTSACKLSDNQMKRLTEKLEAITSKRIELSAVVDETCLGGMRLEYGGYSIDDTVRHRLDDIKKLVQTAGV